MQNGLSGRGQNRMTRNGNINPYTINAVEFGAGEWIGQTTAFSATGSKFLLMSYNIYYPSSVPASGNKMFNMLDSGFTGRCYVQLGSSGQFVIFTNAGSWTSSGGEIVADTWYGLLASLDTTAATKRWQVYKRTNGGAWSALTPSTSNITDDATITNCTQYWVNDSGSPSYWADFWISIGETLDLSVSGNRDKFLPTADKGAAGKTPTGTSPPLFFSGATASWHVNKGAGGGNSINGTLNTAPSAPT